MATKIWNDQDIKDQIMEEENEVTLSLKLNIYSETRQNLSHTKLGLFVASTKE